MSSGNMSHSFTVNQIPRHVWDKSHTVLVPERTCHIPVLPNYDDDSGSQGRIVKTDPERLLVAIKESQPFLGAEISIRLEPANASGWPTQVTLSHNRTETSTDFHDYSDHFLWKEFGVNYRLYLEQSVICPPYNRPITLGMSLEETPLGLVVNEIGDKSAAEMCGIRSKDLLITLQGVRILSANQFFSITSLLTREENVEIKISRNNKILTRKTKLI